MALLRKKRQGMKFKIEKEKYTVFHHKSRVENKRSWSGRRKVSFRTVYFPFNGIVSQKCKKMKPVGRWPEGINKTWTRLDTFRHQIIFTSSNSVHQIFKSHLQVSWRTPEDFLHLMKTGLLEKTLISKMYIWGLLWGSYGEFYGVTNCLI